MESPRTIASDLSVASITISVCDEKVNVDVASPPPPSEPSRRWRSKSDGSCTYVARPLPLGPPPTPSPKMIRTHAERLAARRMSMGGRLHRSTSSGTLPEQVMARHLSSSVIPPSDKETQEKKEKTSSPLSSIAAQLPLPVDPSPSSEDGENAVSTPVFRREKRPSVSSQPSSFKIIMEPLMTPRRNSRALIPMPQPRQTGDYAPMHIRVAGHGLHKDGWVHYKIEVEWMGMEWACYRRFSQFVHLDERVGNILRMGTGSKLALPYEASRKAAINLCKGVAKRSFIRKLNDKFYEKRISGLHAYMQMCSEGLDIVLGGLDGRAFSFMKFITPMQLGDMRKTFSYEQLRNTVPDWE